MQDKNEPSSPPDTAHGIAPWRVIGADEPGLLDSQEDHDHRITHDDISSARASRWTQRYGLRHRLVRIREFPSGVTAPRRVRIYRRGDHYVLQWWDPQAGKNLPDRVDGDLVEALTRARRIEERLARHGSSGLAYRHISHAELVSAYLTDLGQRANAGYIRPATVRRLDSALRHYLTFVQEGELPSPARAGREFVLRLAGYLRERMISPNGHAHTALRRMGSYGYVLDTVRAMYAWAGDPNRGHILPPECGNIFRKSRDQRNDSLVTGLLGEPDITINMATDFLAACDRHWLPVFALLVFYGLRAGEPCMLFREHIADGWIKVQCIPQLEYTTKGKRDKWLPLVPVIEEILQSGGHNPGGTCGLLFFRPNIVKNGASLAGAGLNSLAAQYAQCTTGVAEAVRREEIRHDLLRQAGGLEYDEIHRAFRRIRRRLGWPAAATLKDFRHLFATCMQNAGMPERYIQYLMGHSQGRQAMVHYAHLNQIRQHYQTALESQMKPALDALLARINSLGL